jgi:hypothetical protein
LFLPICVCDQTPRDNPESRDQTPHAGRDQTPQLRVWITAPLIARRSRIAISAPFAGVGCGVWSRAVLAIPGCLLYRSQPKPLPFPPRRSAGSPTSRQSGYGFGGGNRAGMRGSRPEPGGPVVVRHGSPPLPFACSSAARARRFALDHARPKKRANREPPVGTSTGFGRSCGDVADLPACRVLSDVEAVASGVRLSFAPSIPVLWCNAISTASRNGVYP